MTDYYTLANGDRFAQGSRLFVDGITVIVESVKDMGGVGWWVTYEGSDEPSYISRKDTTVTMGDEHDI